MNILLVEDDEEQANYLLRHIHSSFGSDVQILGPYDQFSSVLPHVQQRDISFAIIDIQLYDDLFAGIHIAEMIQELLEVSVLFVSGIADDKVIEKAKGVSNSDFLQKPYDSESFGRAIKRVTQPLKYRSDQVKIVFRPRAKDRFWVKTDRSIYQGLNQNEILFIRAWDHYCKIFVSSSNSPIVTKAGLKKDILEDGLAQYPHFYQLRRNIVINLNHLERIEGNTLYLTGIKLDGDDRLIIPKEKKDELLRVLGVIK